jgi:nitroreductase
MTSLPINEPITEVITKRRSWRTYDGKPVEKEKKDQINNFISSLDKPPFSSKARFELAELDLKGSGKVSGTYGVISKADTFIVSMIEKSPMDMEDVGYLFEKVILFATSIGLDTCWMGASFSRSLFSAKIGLKPEESLPVVSPIGYRAGRRSITDAVFHMTAGSKKRKPWPDLFFEKNFDSPLGKNDAGKLEVPFEMVRLAPSAMNKQPWRLFVDGKKVHFFLKRTTGYESMFKMDLQRIDMGIAMCHFELAADEVGIKGGWKVKKPDIEPLPDGIEYVVTWE